MNRTPPFKEGDRIRLDAMNDPYDPVPPGTEGTVLSCNWFEKSWHVAVKWDNGRSLSMVVPPDSATAVQ